MVSFLCFTLSWLLATSVKVINSSNVIFFISCFCSNTIWTVWLFNFIQTINNRQLNIQSTRRCVKVVSFEKKQYETHLYLFSARVAVISPFGGNLVFSLLYLRFCWPPDPWSAKRAFPNEYSRNWSSCFICNSYAAWTDRAIHSCKTIHVVYPKTFATFTIIECNLYLNQWLIYGICRKREEV